MARDMRRCRKGEENPVIECHCGCGRTKILYDKTGEPHYFIHGHNNKGKHYNFKGYRTFDRGYFRVRAVGHPRACSHGQYVFEHILVYEQYHNCCMLPWGDVHHINGIKTDNKPENLQGLMHGKHSQHHHELRRVIRV